LTANILVLRFRPSTHYRWYAYIMTVLR